QAAIGLITLVRPDLVSGAAAFAVPLRHTDWVVYSKEPFGGSEQVLRYMARYTHRVAISNSCLLAIDGGVSFRWKDYRVDGPARFKVITLTHDDFIRRFLIHVLPASLHRIRHYGLFAKKPGRAQPRDEHGNCSSASSQRGWICVGFGGDFCRVVPIVDAE